MTTRWPRRRHDDGPDDDAVRSPSRDPCGLVRGRLGAARTHFAAQAYFAAQTRSAARRAGRPQRPAARRARGARAAAHERERGAAAERGGAADFLLAGRGVALRGLRLRVLQRPGRRALGAGRGRVRRRVPRRVVRAFVLRGRAHRARRRGPGPRGPAGPPGDRPDGVGERPLRAPRGRRAVAPGLAARTRVERDGRRAHGDGLARRRQRRLARQFPLPLRARPGGGEPRRARDGTRVRSRSRAPGKKPRRSTTRTSRPTTTCWASRSCP